MATIDNIPTEIIDLASRARQSAIRMQSSTSKEKVSVLEQICKQVLADRDAILAANLVDLAAADTRVAAGTMSSSMRKRLLLNSAKFDAMIQGVYDVAELDDPTGKITLARELSPDTQLFRVTVPLGVLLVIFEARPEVLINVAALAIKSGNACILKGGSEAQHTNDALYQSISKALHACDESHENASADHGNMETQHITAFAVQLVSSRASVHHLLSLDRFVDLVIPRGSNSLVRYIQNNTRIPVLGHADGICSIYIHQDADVDIARKVVVDAKVNYPAACNAVETLLVHADVVNSVLPAIATGLWEQGVLIKADTACWAVLDGIEHSDKKLEHATPEDYDTEFLDLIIAVRVVHGLDQAIHHINTHGSRHTESIITSSKSIAERFMQAVDAAGVYWNASTRFADGFRYGFGAEVGVSTNKVHARGPVGVEGLITYRYRIYGKGSIVGELEGPGKLPGKTYTHRPLSDLEIQHIYNS